MARNPGKATREGRAPRRSKAGAARPSPVPASADVPAPRRIPPAAPEPESGPDLLPELRKRVEELTLLYNLGREMAALAEPDVLLQKMVRLIAAALSVEIVSVMLLEEEDGEPVLRVHASSGLPLEVTATARVRLGEGISGFVAETGEPILIRDVSTDPRFGPSPWEGQYRTGSLLSVPLTVSNRVIGVVNLNNKRSGEPFDEDDLHVIATFAGQAALALDNARLYGELREHERTLEQAVARKTAEHERVLQNIGSGILTLDLDGRITSINRAGLDIFGRGRHEDVVGCPLQAIVGEETYLGIVEAAFQERGYKKREMTIQRPDGRDVPVGFSTFTLEGEDHTVDGAIILFRDLTEINELKRMDRLASLGVMSAGIAHEIKNPLTAIKFGLEFLREEVDPRAQEELEIMGKNIERVDAIVNNLLRISRPQKSKFAYQSLNDVLRSTMLLLKKQCASHRIEVRDDMPEGLPLVYVDENQIQQVVLNLALNAIQSMPNGGRILLRTFAGERAAPPAAEPVRYVVAEITDTGPGIPEEAMEYIFHPFYTTRDGGTGLGLSISYRIVQDHDGFIEARNNPGGGATFTLGLPAAEIGRENRDAAS